MCHLYLAGTQTYAQLYLTLILKLGPMETPRDPLAEVYFNM